MTRQREVIPKGSENAPLKFMKWGVSARHTTWPWKKKDSLSVLLKQHIPIQYASVDGKNVGKKQQAGLIRALFDRGRP